MEFNRILPPGMKCLVMLCVVFSSAQIVVSAHNSGDPCVPALFQFGNSLADTGNAAAIFPLALAPQLNPPYGQKRFSPATGRFSDGYLVIDFIALALGLPLLSPYLSSVGANFRHGVNFAFAGATVLNATFYTQRGVSTFVPFSLLDEYGWYLKFRRDADATSKTSATAALLPSPSYYTQGLYVVGEMGGNDYTSSLLSGLSIQQVLQIVPDVVDYIKQTIQNLYASGARVFLVPNIPTLGCSPLFLTLFASNSSQSYDQFGCLAAYENITDQHNRLLLGIVRQLRTQLPDALIIYADYHSIVRDVLTNPSKYGISKTTLLRACCGGGGNYNYNPNAPCGSPAASTCANPNSYIFWDEFHFTDSFNQIVANAYLSPNSRYLDPQGVSITKCSNIAT